MAGKVPLYRESAIRRIRARLSRPGMDALLIRDHHDITYLAGFYSPGVVMLVERGARPSYFVDTMNGPLAEKMLEGAKLNLVTASGPVMNALARHIEDRKIRKIGFSGEDLSVLAHDRLSKLVPGAKFVPDIKGLPVSSIMEGIREIKAPEEIRVLRKAAKETVRVWREARKNIETGMSEQDIAAMIDVCIRRRGYKNSFPTIAAAGENTAYPHAIPGAKRLESGEHLLVDFGLRCGGYCSDLTRIYYKGRINWQIKDFRESVLKAHDLAIKEIKPGAMIGSVVGRAEGLIKKNGLGDLILHGLGHGVGLEIHEKPFLRRGSRRRLREGMVLTVEPGLYKPGLGGIREEDMILVTAKGCEVLTS